MRFFVLIQPNQNGKDSLMKIFRNVSRIARTQFKNGRKYRFAGNSTASGLRLILPAFLCQNLGPDLKFWISF